MGTSSAERNVKIKKTLKKVQDYKVGISTVARKGIVYYSDDPDIIQKANDVATSSLTLLKKITDGEITRKEIENRISEDKRPSNILLILQEIILEEHENLAEEDDSKILEALNIALTKSRLKHGFDFDAKKFIKYFVTHLIAIVLSEKTSESLFEKEPSLTVTEIEDFCLNIARERFLEYEDEIDICIENPRKLSDVIKKIFSPEK